MIRGKSHNDLVNSLIDANFQIVDDERFLNGSVERSLHEAERILRESQSEWRMPMTDIFRTLCYVPDYVPPHLLRNI